MNYQFSRREVDKEVAAVGKQQARFAVRRCCRALQPETGGPALQSIYTMKTPPFLVESCVRVTYFHGQSPGNYRRRMCA